MPDLRELIDAFGIAKAAHDGLPEDQDDEGPEWDAYEATERAVIVHPCQSIEDVRLKAHFFLDSIGPRDTLRYCYSSGVPTLDLFLRSLLGEAQP